MARARTCKGQGLSRAIKGHQGPMSAARDCCQGEPRPIFPLPSCNAVLVSSRWQIDGHLASPGITWPLLRMNIGLSLVVIGCPCCLWDANGTNGCHVCLHLSCLDLRFTAIYLMPKPRLMVPQLHLVNLGESWWLMWSPRWIMMNQWADKDSKWWLCGLGTSPNLAQVYRPRPDLQAAQNDVTDW